MSDASDRLNELKIDRNAPVAPRKMRIWPFVVIASLVGLALAWHFLGAGNDSALVETEVARRPPTAVAANSVLDASGYVTARRQATVSSETTGKVAEVLVEEGMRVERDQIVARLDDSTLQAQRALAVAQQRSAIASLTEMEAQLRGSRLERDRLRDLNERKLVSVSSLDAAEANFDALAARLETGRENVKVAGSSIALADDAIDDMTIRAPFAGVVVSKNAQPGEMISPISAGGGFTRTGICTIVDMDSLEIEVDVNEAYIQRVKKGQRVSATLDAYPDWQISAEVIAIIPTADRQKATVRVRVGFLERDERVLRDMGVKVAFLGSSTPTGPEAEIKGVLISKDSAHSDSEGDYVWRVSAGVVERRTVKLGASSNRRQVLVSEGLAAGDTVVKTSARPLRAGQKVNTD